MHAVPDEFSNVIFIDVSTATFSLPVIVDGKVEINSLYIEPDALMTI